MKLSLPKKVQIHEVVLRDGIQNERKLVSTEEKLRLIRELVACGVRRIEVSSFVNRSLVPQMADAEALWERIERKRSVLYSALILSEGGHERAIRCRVPHVGIFVSASETHSLKNSNKPVSEALKEAVRLIGMAQDAGMKVRAGVMNAFGCAYEGQVPVARVLKLVRAFVKRGPAEICLADSSGMANPVQMEKVLVRIRHETADADLSLHLHNTRGLGLACRLRRALGDRSLLRRQRHGNGQRQRHSHLHSGAQLQRHRQLRLRHLRRQRRHSEARA